jgi:type VI secretion system protein ImpG
MEDILSYYKKELSSLHKEIKGISRNNPNLLPGLPDNFIENPHIKLLIESFSLLHANIKLKQEEHFIEYISVLFDILYPHYNSPIPSSTIVEVELDTKQTTPVYLAKGNLVEMRHNNIKCTFSTCYHSTILPLRITNALCQDSIKDDLKIKRKADNKNTLSITLQAINKSTFNKFGNSNIRFNIRGATDIKYLIYQNILDNVELVTLSDEQNNNVIMIDKSCIKKLGFTDDENLFPYNKKSFSGYRLISEFFICEDKFLFFDLDISQYFSNFSDHLKISFVLNNDALQDLVSAEQFAVNAVPIINLFPMESDPIAIKENEMEYPIILDKKYPEMYKIFAVNKVKTLSAGTEKEIYKIFDNNYQNNLTESMYVLNRKRDDSNSGVFISIIGQNNFTQQQNDYFYVIADCFNGTLPQQIFDNNAKKLVFINHTLPVAKIRCHKKLSNVSYHFSRKDKKWDMLAHFSRNYLNLMNNSHAKHLLCEILSMYDFDGSVNNKLLIKSITDVKIIDKIERINVAQYNNFCKGSLIEISFNDTTLPKGLVYLFLSILENYLSIYCPINSFIQLTAKSIHNNESLYKGFPRNGTKCLI